MKGFLSTATIYVPRKLVLAAHDHLRKVGQNKLEGFALWAGTQDGTRFYVKRTIIPAQTGLQSADGVCVTVSGDELHRSNRWLFDNEMALIAQLRSPAGRAYHS